jgi:hypothetical protein
MGTPTRYQRVTNATDYALTAEDGTPFPLFIRLDGSDDWLQTNTITPGTDKVAVFAGVRKLSDAAAGVVAELSASSNANDGSLAIGSGTATGDAGRRTWFVAGYGISTEIVGGAATYPSPETIALTGLFDANGSDQAGEFVLRRNAILQSLTFNNAQRLDGNFLAYPLYIGRRGGTSFPFNGNIHQLIVRFGPNLDAATIANAEKFVGTKTGITL